MSPSTTPIDLHVPRRDLLEYLPASTTKRYTKGQVIYSPNDPPRGIYLVISGKVGITQLAGTGQELLLDILRPEEVFGESAFLNVSRSSEQATALEPVDLMSWAIGEVEEMVQRRSGLAMALLQILAQRNVEFTRRIESFSTETIEKRLLRALVRFSTRLGTLHDDGSSTMMPFTHQMLSQYVGTSREIVSHYMGDLRRQGYLSYSRRGIVLYPDAMNARAN